MKILSFLNNIKYILLLILMYVGLSLNGLSLVGTIITNGCTLFLLYKVIKKNHTDIIINVLIYLALFTTLLILFKTMDFLLISKFFDTRILLSILGLILIIVKKEFKYKKNIIINYYLILLITTYLKHDNLIINILNSILFIIFIIRYKFIIDWKLKNLKFITNISLLINFILLTCLYFNNLTEVLGHAQINTLYKFNYKEMLFPFLIINIFYILIYPLLNIEKDNNDNLIIEEKVIDISPSKLP